MTHSFSKGIRLSLLTMFFWALHDVSFRYAAVEFRVDPTLFICFTLFVAAVTLILVAGPGKGGMSTLKRGHTWSYGVLEILLNISQMFALLYITTTEMNFLNRFTIIMSILGAWLFFGRRPKKTDLLGMSLVAGGLFYIAAHLDDAIQLPALVCIFFVALTSTATAMIGEKHPDSNDAHTIKDRCRVTGYVLLVCSFFFLMIAFAGALIKTQASAAALPLISGLPDLDAFLNKPTFFMAFILGITVMPLAMYYFFYATRVAKTETFMLVSSFLPFMTFIVEYSAYAAGLLSVNAISAGDLVAGLVIVIGALLIEFLRRDKPAKGSDFMHTPLPTSSADYDMVCSALRFSENDMVKTAKLLGVSTAELDAVFQGKGRTGFKTDAKTYQTLLRNYQRNIATADPLTGLSNRDALLTTLDSALKSGQDVAVIFLDLNKFKPINDTYGHEAGDKLLRLVARRLKNSAPKNALVARLGGDEFIVMLRNANQGDAHDVSAILDRALKEPFKIEGMTDPVRISGSFGIALSQSEGQSAESLIKAADDAMYAMKRQR